MSTIPKSLRDGLVCELLMNGNANDTSGNGNNGTVNGATLTTDMLGRANRAYDFDGSNDYVSVPSSSDLQLTTVFTINMWIYRDSDNGTYERFLSKGTTGYDYWFQIQNVDVLQIGFRNSGESYYLNSISTISTGQWYNIVGIFDGTEFKIYINGNLDNSGYSSSSNPSGQSAQTSTEDLNFGRLYAGVWYYNFNGKIALTRIYNRALTQAEIQQLYIRGIGSGI